MEQTAGDPVLYSITVFTTDVGLLPCTTLAVTVAVPAVFRHALGDIYDLFHKSVSDYDPRSGKTGQIHIALLTEYINNCLRHIHGKVSVVLHSDDVYSNVTDSQKTNDNLTFPEDYIAQEYLPGSSLSTQRLELLAKAFPAYAFILALKFIGKNAALGENKLALVLNSFIGECHSFELSAGERTHYYTRDYTQPNASPPRLSEFPESFKPRIDWLNAIFDRIAEIEHARTISKDLVPKGDEHTPRFMKAAEELNRVIHLLQNITKLEKTHLASLKEAIGVICDYIYIQINISTLRIK